MIHARGIMQLLLLSQEEATHAISSILHGEYRMSHEPIHITYAGRCHEYYQPYVITNISVL